MLTVYDFLEERQSLSLLKHPDILLATTAIVDRWVFVCRISGKFSSLTDYHWNIRIFCSDNSVHLIDGFSANFNDSLYHLMTTYPDILLPHHIDKLDFIDRISSKFSSLSDYQWNILISLYLIIYIKEYCYPAKVRIKRILFLDV